VGRDRTALQGHAEQQPRRDFRSDRRREVVGDRDGRDLGERHVLAAQDTSDPGTDIAHIRGPRGEQLVG
jgi:hypothetical protein